MIKSLSHPELIWDSNKEPHNKTFDDCYFPTSYGREAFESCFSNPNNLAERFSEASDFAIYELGFGTGLNFFLTSELWKKHSKETASLKYISFELHPFKAGDLESVLRNYVEDQKLLNRFLSSYPPCSEGVFEIGFPESDLELILVQGDAEEYLTNLDGPKADAWFLDGFSPKNNEKLWSEKIFQSMSKLSDSQTTVGSFSVAKDVRDGLEKVGFLVEKLAGDERKKEVLGAKFKSPTKVHKSSKPKSIAIIGAGLSGANLSYSFSKKDVEISVFEKGSEIAAGASGNSVGILTPYLANRPSGISQFYFEGALYFLQRVRALEDISKKKLFSPVGSLQLPSTTKFEKLIQNFSSFSLPSNWVELYSRQDIKNITSLEVVKEALFYPRAGLAFPKLFSEVLIRESKAELHLNTEITSLSLKDNSWVLESKGEKVGEFDVVVIASGYEASKLELTSWLPLEPVRGQCMTLKANEKSKKLNTVISSSVYLAPQVDGEHVVGASYSHDDFDSSVRQADNLELLDKVQEIVPEFGFLKDSILKARTSFRTSTYDRSPFVGNIPVEGIEKSNLYVSVGFGSRGLSSTALASEIVKSEVFELGQVCTNHAKEALSPCRYLKKLNKN